MTQLIQLQFVPLHLAAQTQVGDEQPGAQVGRRQVAGGTDPGRMLCAAVRNQLGGVWVRVGVGGWEEQGGSVGPVEAGARMAGVGGAPTGWFGVGFSSGGGMVGSDAVLGWAGGAATAYELDAKSVDGVKEEPSVALSGASVTVADGKTLLKFARPLAAGKVPLSAAGSTTLLYAAGTQSGKSYHDAGQGSFAVALAATAAASVRAAQYGAVARHGVHFHRHL